MLSTGIISENYNTFSQYLTGQREKKYIQNLPDYFNPQFSAKSRVSTNATATFNIVSTLLDGTVLSLPYAFSKCGIFLGLGVLVIVSIATYVSLIVITSLVFKN